MELPTNASDPEVPALRPFHPRPSLPPSLGNHRKPILKFRRGGFRGARGGRNSEAVPYPHSYDGLQIQGLLVGSQVFLYDLVAYRFLHSHRGYFGEMLRQKPFVRGVQTVASNFDSEKDDFPPAPNVHPVAVLNLYEAYFLSLVGGCLDIWDGISGKPIDPGDLMGVLCSIRPLFPYYFAAYHHFRKLKYVVHSGLKFGTDFVLYEYGPMKTHSVYMAYIVVPGLRDPRITLVDTLQRVANAAKKDALLVQVVANGMNKIDLLDPNSFERMEITEMIVRRRERIFDKPAEESEPDPLPPARMVPRAVLNSDAQNSAESSSPAAFVPRVPYGIRPQRGAFRYPTVYMGVRRVFRGRSLTLPNGGNRGNFRGIPSRPGFFRPPMFISRNSSGWRPTRMRGRGARFWRT